MCCFWKLLEPISVLKALNTCGHCGESLFELLPYNTPTTKYWVNWGTRLCTEIMTPLVSRKVRYVCTRMAKHVAKSSPVESKLNQSFIMPKEKLRPQMSVSATASE